MRPSPAENVTLWVTGDVTSFAANVRITVALPSPVAGSTVTPSEAIAVHAQFAVRATSYEVASAATDASFAASVRTGSGSVASAAA